MGLICTYMHFRLMLHKKYCFTTLLQSRFCKCNVFYWQSLVGHILNVNNCLQTTGLKFQFLVFYKVVLYNRIVACINKFEHSFCWYFFSSIWSFFGVNDGQCTPATFWWAVCNYTRSTKSIIIELCKSVSRRILLVLNFFEKLTINRQLWKM